ncbi:hypothetical protein NKOR_05830 [Candidatus Nitrosopumilus koreensis AR1]|uniref:Uncharacterized protein n=1 Tax=Candidatus Nitrosopumilus koreensis AR1 TaxID=1229908 RepID=K0B6E9_9ARCH|nr:MULTISPECIES: hypothetical protein [Nitrosopumilus]AFS81049.1 hypothetical protein NKOR_05830 [Candidatus Nitrosopumilus koreensis AR1]
MSNEGVTASSPIGQTSHGINYKIIALIVGLTIVDLLYGFYFFEGTHFDIKDGFYMAGIATVGAFSIVVAKKYHGSEMLGKAYLFLGLGFFAWFIGDLGYYYQQFVLDIDPWPSPFDAGFAANYVFAILHLSLNTRFFKPQWSTAMKATLVIIPIVAVGSFTVVAYEAWGVYDELLFDLAYSNIFVIGISVTLAFAVIGVSVFRHSVLKETWLLLALGIFLWTVADSIYYYLETIEAFTHNHPINSLWSAAFMLIIYALYKHMKAL